jgi:DNA polymerase-3 subunit alpha/error-prone DNA polymerase
MNRFLTQHNFDKTPLPAQAPEFLNVSILYPIENTPDFLGVLNF